MAGKHISTLNKTLKSLTSHSSASQACLPTKPTSSHTLTSNQFRSAYTNTSVYDGNDSKHWLVIMNLPEKSTSWQELYDLYVKTLTRALGVGREEDAKSSIYSTFFGPRFAFGALLDQSVVNAVLNVDGVKDVVPDAFVDTEKQCYGGEPITLDPEFDKIQESQVKNGEEPRGRGGIPIPSDDNELKDWDARKKRIMGKSYKYINSIMHPKKDPEPQDSGMPGDNPYPITKVRDWK